MTKSQKLQKPEKFQEYRPKRIIKFDKVNQIYANTATKIERTQFSKKNKSLIETKIYLGMGAR